ncbi:single-stranded DNA-binding protein [Streptomyces virginiae]|uniref:single-stranded DNA-binding protein n=1 Tax=Streptomyces virginiae TaxID=1961 RepID=UPI00367F19D2
MAWSFCGDHGQSGGPRASAVRRCLSASSRFARSGVGGSVAGHRGGSSSRCPGRSEEAGRGSRRAALAGVRRQAEFTDGEPLFLRCTLWRQAAENAAETLTRGMRVIVTGRLKQRTFDDKEGQRRTVVEIDAEEAAPSLIYAKATVTKAHRPGSGPAASRPVSAPAEQHPF